MHYKKYWNKPELNTDFDEDELVEQEHVHELLHEEHGVIGTSNDDFDELLTWLLFKLESEENALDL